MPHTPSDRIHPTAIISPEAELADVVVAGPYVVIEGRVRLGPGCMLRPYVHLCGPLSMGSGNLVFSGAVLGEQPQHMKYAGEPTTVEIGDDNVFRENVTVHRGTKEAWTTHIGNGNFFMAGSHVAHDCHIGNRCILANGALVGGHCTLEDNVYLSGNAAVHQFMRVGRLALLSGVSATTKDVPPFIIQQNFNCVVGINVVGMRRAGMRPEQINGVRRAFHVLYREGHTLPVAMAKTEQQLGHIDAVMELIHFIRQSKRGINLKEDHKRFEAA